MTGILLFDGVEALDFAGPYEVFSVASRLTSAKHAAAARLFDVSTVAASRVTVRARHGLRIVPDLQAAEVQRLDLLVVPGDVMDALLANVGTHRWFMELEPLSRQFAMGHSCWRSQDCWHDGARRPTGKI